MALSSADIKRQILMNSDKSGIRTKIQQALENQSMTEGEILESGNAFEAMTKTKGWILIEAFMLRRMDITGLIFTEGDNSAQKGIARGYMELMQYIDQTIKARDMILDRESKKETGKTPEEKD